MKRNLIWMVIVGVAALLVGGVFFMYQNTNSAVEEALPIGATHSVVLTEQGYEPQTLSIARGDQVVFTSSRGFEHWPASNIHPTHNVYAAFDPQRPLQSEESWAFQFTKEGEWEFHDHLNSTFTGTITVTP